MRFVFNGWGTQYGGSEGAGLEGDGKGGSVLLGGVMMVKSSSLSFFARGLDGKVEWGL